MTVDERALAIYEVLLGPMADVGEKIGIQSPKIGPQAKEFNEVSRDMVQSAKDLLDHPKLRGSNSNDAISFKQTFFLGLVPQSPDPEDDDSVWAKHFKVIAEIAAVLGIKKSSADYRRLEDAAILRRRLFKYKEGQETKFLQVFKREYTRKFDFDDVQVIIDWILHHCTKVIESPNAKDEVWIDDPHNPGKKIRARKYFYAFSERELFLELTNPETGCPLCFDENGEPCISQSFLNTILPRNLVRMTQAQKQMCGCTYCIDARGWHQALKGWRNHRVVLLELKVANLLKMQNVRSPAVHAVALASAKKKLEDFKLQAFHFVPDPADPNGTKVIRKPRWERAKDAADSMTCAIPPDAADCPAEDRLEKTGLCKLKCALGHCKNCSTKLDRAVGEDVTHGPTNLLLDNDFVTWKKYEGRYSCKAHGIIPPSEKNKTRCPSCIVTPTEKPDKDPGRKVHYCRNKKPIGDFMCKYETWLKEYRYHMQLVILHGKNHCVKDRLKHYKDIEGAVYILRDYADRIGIEMNDQAQSQGMSNRQSMGMEGIAVKFMKEDPESEERTMKEVLEFFSFIADDKRQDARTSLQHTSQLIKKLQDEYGLLKRHSGAVMYEQSDGCAKQYTSAIAWQCCIWLANQYGICINKMTTAPQHGKSIVDGISGADKKRMKELMLTANMPLFALDNATITEDGVAVQPATVLAVAMNDPERMYGLKGDKHKVKEGHFKCDRKEFFAVEWGDDLKVKIPSTTIEVKSGFPKKTEKVPHPTNKNKRRTLPRQGPKNHYHLYADWRIPGMNQCAVRRIGCSCKACHDQITLPWDKAIEDWTKQPKFMRPVNCKYAAIFEDLNDWKFVTLGPTEVKTQAKQKMQEEEIQAVLDEFLLGYEEMWKDSVREGGYAAMNCDEETDGYYLIRWRGEPYALQSPQMVEGADLEEMPVGTIVCEGQYCDRLAGNPNWYHHDYRAPTRLFRLQYMLAADIPMEPYDRNMEDPPKLKRSKLEPWQIHPTMAEKNIKRVPEAALASLLEEKEARDGIGFAEIIWTGSDDDDEAEDSEDEMDVVEVDEEEEDEEDE